MPVVILRDDDTGASLAVGVGVGESSAIAASLDGIELDRPLACDVMTCLLAHVGAAIDRVEIDDARDGLYHATVYVTLGDATSSRCVAIDARPSDALALALRSQAPIRVARAIVATDGDLPEAPRNDAPAPPPAPPPPSPASPASPSDLRALGDEAFGKWKM